MSVHLLLLCSNTDLKREKQLWIPFLKRDYPWKHPHPTSPIFPLCCLSCLQFSNTPLTSVSISMLQVFPLVTYRWKHGKFEVQVAFKAEWQKYRQEGRRMKSKVGEKSEACVRKEIKGGRQERWNMWMKRKPQGAGWLWQPNWSPVWLQTQSCHSNEEPICYSLQTVCWILMMLQEALTVVWLCVTEDPHPQSALFTCMRDTAHLLVLPLHLPQIRCNSVRHTAHSRFKSRVALLPILQYVHTED